MKICTKCKRKKPLTAFNKSSRSADGRYPSCKDCRKAYRQENKDSISKKRHANYMANRKHILTSQKEYTSKNRDRILKRHREYYRANTEQFKKYSAEHKEEKAAYWQIYYSKNRGKLIAKSRRYTRENPEKVREAKRKWCEKNPGKPEEMWVAWYAEHRKERLAYNKEYRTEHPERSRYDQRLRKARKLAVNEDFTAEQDSFVRTYWGNECAVCGIPQQHEEKALAIDHWYPLSKGHALTMGNAVLMCRSCNSKKKDRYPDKVFDAITIARIEAEMKAQVTAWQSRIADTRMRRFT